MKNIRSVVLILFISVSACLKAQDSLKLLNHEIGFNTVGLVKQMISNNPSSQLSQLPYLVFYNLYYEDLVGARVGLGVLNQKTESTSDNQSFPRTTTNNSLNLRLGASYNFVKYKRLTLNVFGDFLFEKFKSETVATLTLQTFPNPVQTITQSSSNLTNGVGAQVGVGVKFNIYKHLSLYAEVPFSYIIEDNKSSTSTSSPGSSTISNTNKQTNKLTSITLPTTVYLVLRF